MKKRIKDFAKYLLPIFPIVFTAFILATGCATRPQPNPLAGWNFSSLDNLHSNKAISDDYQDYLKKLTRKKKAFVGSVDFFENSMGQHAVEIKVGVRGTWWEHILVYDKDNKRINAITYSNGGYSS